MMAVSLIVSLISWEKDKSIGFADNQQHYDGCLVNCFVN
jgi:hypothetical protein